MMVCARAGFLCSVVVAASLVAVASALGPEPHRDCHLPDPGYRSGSNGTTASKLQNVKSVFPKVLKSVYVPMRDGVKLHTTVISPAFSTKSKWPVVIDRSPYGVLGTELLADVFLLFDYVAIGQDMRGTCQSEGNFSVFVRFRCSLLLLWALRKTHAFTPDSPSQRAAL